MYQKRHIYLTSYITVFNNNIDNIVNNKIKIPRLDWYPAPTAKKFNIENFHIKKCNYGTKYYWMCKQVKKYLQYTNVNICPCDTALFFRCMYGDILDIIWGRYKNLRKKHTLQY